MVTMSPGSSRASRYRRPRLVPRLMRRAQVATEAVPARRRARLRPLDRQQGLDGRLALELGHLRWIVRDDRGVAGTGTPVQAWRLRSGEVGGLIEVGRDLPARALRQDPDGAAARP